MIEKYVAIYLLMVFSSVLTTRCDEREELEIISNSGAAPVADDTEMPPIADVLEMPPVADELEMPPVADVLEMPPVADDMEAGDPAVADEMEMLLPDFDKRGTSGSRLSYEERVDFLKAHNDYRKNVDPPASNMQFMVWNEELAAMAQEWADQCVWKHGHPQRNPKPFPYIGQNIHATTASTVTGRAVTTSWYNEVRYYKYSTNKCVDGKVCGHYTQVIWAKTNNLGCATASCPQLIGTRMKNAKFTVCNYGPGGNYVGQKPYSEGIKCSACPPGMKCRSDLCVSRPKCGAKTCANGGRLNFVTCECRCPPNYNGADCSIKGPEPERSKRGGRRTNSLNLLYALIRGLRDMAEDQSLAD